MLRIRFSRTGKNNQATYRLVVTPRRSASDSRSFLEVLGHYIPAKHERSVNKERVEYWLSKGAKPSDTVWNILVAESIVKGKKRPVHNVAKAKKGEGKAEEKKAGNEVSGDAGSSKTEQ